MTKGQKDAPFEIDPEFEQAIRDAGDVAVEIGKAKERGVKRRKKLTAGALAEGRKDDPVNHPSHYTAHPSGVECIRITEHMTFNLGNAVKYIWRADAKNGLEDLRKAIWYVEREIERLS